VTEIQCRIVLADDHSLFRQGLKRILSERPELEVVGEAGDGLELLSLVKQLNPHLVILDISMPRLRGIEAIQEIRLSHGALKILVLTMHNDADYLFETIAAGADGYLLKDDAEKDLFFAIDMVTQGRVYISRFLAEQSRQDWVQLRRGERSLPNRETLTTRERQVLKLIAEGRSSKEIGDLLFISHRTVERHRSNIMGKLNLTGTVDLIKYAINKGYA
jgi:DNA-binding NarL/FixJ family response regulator